MTLLLLVAIILGVLGLLKVLHADFMFKFYAVAAGTLVAIFFLGLVICSSLSVLCDEAHLTAKALDVLQTPLAIAIVVVFGGIEHGVKKRKQKKEKLSATR